MSTSLRDGSLPGCIPRDREQNGTSTLQTCSLECLGPCKRALRRHRKVLPTYRDIHARLLNLIHTAPPYVPAQPGNARRIIPLGKKKILLQTLLEGSRDLRGHTPYSSPKRVLDRHQRADRYLPTTKCLSGRYRRRPMMSKFSIFSILRDIRRPFVHAVQIQDNASR
ncbi:hypothetical protein BDV38DRAFT_98999 [Aspergillus pseudotamarii]|uniref:Uncharacterized protein n=1 Tax=Aspergillus pseudotamarii TaxID=132259 RepID=A0A5N6SQP8_ASPPS|nr:uncharacterized protein BDV38DRAFT_98999 [Aspergillus pseudotamarii]KAE8137016.1 hypothetical protein BDV38DRAFT_98999 [Aspergillus pseudotamarii]